MGQNLLPTLDRRLSRFNNADEVQVQGIFVTTKKRNDCYTFTKRIIESVLFVPTSQNE